MRKISRTLFLYSFVVIILLVTWKLGQLVSTALSLSPTGSGLRQPLATDAVSSSPGPGQIPDSWNQETSQDGYLEVDQILHDPRTTKDPIQMENIAPPSPGPTVKLSSSSQSSSSTVKQKHKTRVKSNLNYDQNVKNEDFLSVMNYNSHFKPHITKDLFISGFKERNRIASEKCSHNNILLTIIVISSPNHFEQREAIRQSWGDVIEENVAISFLVGISKDETTQERVIQESAKYKDLIVNNITDTYENLSLKTLSAFNWMTSFCEKSKFLLKVDDDMFVQVDKILTKVKEIQEEKEENRKLILGNISRGWKPVRNPKSKYYITEAQYSEEKYPDFATGPSYLVSREAVKQIFWSAMKFNYIHLEDVFLTGVVAENVGVKRLDVNEFKNNAVRIPAQFMGCTIVKSFTIHKVGPNEQKELLDIAKNPNCGKQTNKKKLNKEQLALQTKKLMEQMNLNI